MNELNIEELFKRIDLDAKRGAAIALAEHKKAGHNIYIWKDDKSLKYCLKKLKSNEYLPNK